jgi:hypothetical protein
MPSRKKVVVISNASGGSKKPSKKQSVMRDLPDCKFGSSCKHLLKDGECQLRHPKEELVAARRRLPCPHDDKCAPRNGRECDFGFHPKKDNLSKLRATSSVTVEEVKESKSGVEEKSNTTNLGSSAVTKESLFRDVRLKLLEESMSEFVAKQAALEREQAELRRLSLKIQKLIGELKNNTN